MRRGMWRQASLPIFLGLISTLAGAAAGATSSIHTVVSTQCTEDIYFEWQAIGLAYSFKRSGQPGPLTRLLSCSEEKLAAYKWLNIVPTFVVPDVEYDEEHEDHYTAYNKPFAVAAWLRVVKPREEYVMVIDADSILRKPFIPEELHLELGQAHTPYHFEVMTGVTGELAERHVPYVEPRRDWLAGPEGRKADRVGPPYIMHREDMETVAPLWYHFTKQVRNDPEAWNLTGDGSVHRPGGRSWISEMYGYAFAAATADVWHQQVDYTANLVPGYGPIGPPKVLHYGNELAINNITYYEFNKIDLKANRFNPLECPPWAKKDGKFTSGLLPFPPSPLSFTSKGLDLLRDLLAIEPAVVLNAAFCERHLRGCPQHEHLQACKKVAKQELELDEAFDALQVDLRKVPCKDWHKECPEWGAGNFCNSNPRFMWYACRKTCGTCFKPDLEVRWHEGINASMMAAAKAKSHCHEIRQQLLLGGDYDLDYSTDGLGEAEDPCEVAVEQAKQIALLAAAEQKESLEAELQAKAKAGAQQPAGGTAVAAAAAAAGAGEVQKRPEGWVLPHETLPADVVVRLKNPMPLSKRLRVNFTSGAAAVQPVTATTAAPVAAVHESAPEVRPAPHLRAALRLRAAPHGTSRSVHAFILFLDWFGVVAMWACAVGLVLVCVRRPLARGLLRGRSSAQLVPVKHK